MIDCKRIRSAGVTVMEIPLRITDNRTKPNVQKPFSDSSVRCYPLAERLIALLYRIVDLLKIVQDHVVHPDFQGSYSMKAVAPALAPDLTYGDLDIADGGDASAAFYRIVADPTLSTEARAGLRESLLMYCQRDTLALARVHQWLFRDG
jgi:predicted RecB family nuclease